MKKIVIKISEKDYDDILNGEIKASAINWSTFNAVRNGTPLTDILDKIKDEIEGVIQEETVIDQSGGEYEHITSKLDPDDVLQIIEKYKKNEE